MLRKQYLRCTDGRKAVDTHTVEAPPLLLGVAVQDVQQGAELLQTPEEVGTQTAGSSTVFRGPA